MKTVRNRCNVLFKVSDSNQILMSHSTMDSYIALQRVFKYIQFGSRTKITYSSYPGCVSSTDDFFIINGHLVVTETTLDFGLDSEQQKNMLDTGYHYIPEYYKVTASNHLAKSAKEWTEYMNTMKSAIYYS